MDTISEDIKNDSFGRIYLIYGKEAYLINACKNRLADAVVPKDDTMNRTLFTGENTDTGRIMELSETLPFLSSRRLILIEDSGLFKKAVDEPFADYIGQIPEGTVIVFAESEVDKKRRLYKEVKEHGKIICCDPPEGDGLLSWAAAYLSKNGRKIRKKTAELLFELAGTDMNLLKNEMDKLIGYSSGREEITDDDVRKICSPNPGASIFAMLDDIASGRQKKALERYYELVIMNEAALHILALLAMEFNMLLLAKDLSRKGASLKEKMAVMGRRDFAVRKYDRMAERFTGRQIEEALDSCISVENDIKKGRINERLGVELLIIKCSGNCSKSGGY